MNTMRPLISPVAPNNVPQTLTLCHVCHFVLQNTCPRIPRLCNLVSLILIVTDMDLMDTLYTVLF